MPEPPERVGPTRSAAWLRADTSLPIWSCSVWGLPCHWHYCQRGALLPHLFTLTTTAWGRLLEECRWITKNLVQKSAPRSGAVCFLWHLPSTGLEARVPDVIRHTALWSSDFPLPKTPACAKIDGSDRPVLLPVVSVSRKRGYQLR